MLNKITILFGLMLVMASCGSDESLEDQFIGRWTGNLTQPDCCTFDIDVTISGLEVGQNSATGRYFNSSFDICNDDIFFCDSASANASDCSFSWRLDVLSDMSITLFEDSDGGDCADGTVTLQLIDDNTLDFRWVDVADPLNITIGQITKS